MANYTQRLTRRDLGRAAVAAALASAPGLRAAGTIPKRPLGKTGLEVGILGIGASPLGAPEVTQGEVNRVIDAALEAGINYLDTAPIYRMSERRLGPALKGKREKFVLVTKVEATSKQDAIWSVNESLLKLQTEYLDVVHIHNVGRTDRFPSLDVLFGPDGVLTGLKELKQQGLVRHIGLTSHLRPARALPVLATGDIEVVMCAANFVDRHTYNFEGTVFADAKKRGLGVVAMKILGGTLENGARLSAPEHYGDAVRYALGIPGLSVAIMGIQSIAELNKAVATVLDYKPFSQNELTRLATKGKAMAAEWGELRGPVAWS